MAILKIVEPTKCYECDQLVPPYNPNKPDDVIYRERNGVLHCLECHEEYIERD